MKLYNTLAAILATISPTFAAVVVVSDSTTHLIPDGTSAGLARQLTISTPGEIVTNVALDISINAAPGDNAFLGDLYVYLVHDSNLSVILNRVGRRSDSAAGYGDDQPLTATFSASGSNDIHNYRVAIGGNQTTSLAGSLTGTWQPDGRATDPSVVLLTDARTAGLSVFSGAPASGNWNLFVADLSAGAQHQITGWSLTVTTAIPEPSSALLMTVLASCCALRRRRSRWFAR